MMVVSGDTYLSCSIPKTYITMKTVKKLCLMTASTFVCVTLSANAADGAAGFAKDCAKCHGADGKGDTPMGKKLKCKDLTAEKLSDAQIEKSIKEGVKDGDKVRMKAFKDLSDADVQALVKFVHTLK
jgi:mono/diheme cytochrome c family protein